MDWKTLFATKYNGLKLGIIISISYARRDSAQAGHSYRSRLRTKKPAQIMTANGTQAGADARVV